MDINYIHNFDLTIEEMKDIQNKLMKELDFTPMTKKPRIVCGVDLSFIEDTGLAIIAVLKYPEMELIDVVYHHQKIGMPYIPGLLGFRELPVFLNAWDKLTTEPDLVFFDGHGYAHPRRLGIASHASFFINKPTIGVAKSVLCGKYEKKESIKGNYSYLTDKEERIGFAMWLRDKVKPVFVSPGNYISFEQAFEITKECGSGYKLPEPTRLAHYYSQKLKSKVIEGRI